MSKNTVKLCLRRFQSEGNDGLIDRRNDPNVISHKTSTEEEKKIVGYRLQASCYGARRLKYFFDLTPSVGAIHPIIKSKGLTARRRKKYQKKNDLREVKAKYHSLQKVQMDIKYLTDIAVVLLLYLSERAIEKVQRTKKLLGYISDQA